MTKFACFECSEQFTEQNAAITHLKTKHKIKEKQTNIKCLVNYDFCRKHFLTFSGLRKHMKTCSESEYCGITKSAEVNSISRCKLSIFFQFRVN